VDAAKGKRNKMKPQQQGKHIFRFKLKEDFTTTYAKNCRKKAVYKRDDLEAKKALLHIMTVE
jgi:hypothetical protein